MAPPKKNRKAVTASDFQERYEALKKLDPEIALQYAVGVNSRNREAIRNTGSPKFQGGFGMITRQDVDLILAAATDDQQITKKEEEALLIILATKQNWGNGDAKEYMIGQIEKNLSLFWSATSIDRKTAALLLAPTNRIDFTSEGDNHRGTRRHYNSAEFQTLVQLIGRGEIAAREVSRDGFYKKIPGAGPLGYYTNSTNELHLVSGLSARDRQAGFAYFATVAIHDFRNAASPLKFRHADAVIVQAFVALAMGTPYPISGDGELAVATRQGGAAAMLMTPVAARKAAWKTAFMKAYDEVVDAYVARVGGARPDTPLLLEDAAVQSDEKKVFMQELNKVLRGSSTRSKPRP